MGHNGNMPKRNKINILKTTIIALAAHRPAHLSLSLALALLLSRSLTLFLCPPENH